MADEHVVFGPKAVEQIAKTVREVARMMQNPEAHRGRWQGNTDRRYQVILSADLFAAVNTKRDPSTASARILRRLPNGDLSLSTDTITIVNRFMHISVDAGTYAKAEWIDGEWQLYAADCATGSSSGST